MNNFTRQLPLTDEGRENAWKNKVATGMTAGSIIAGDGIDVDYGPNGTTISIQPKNEDYQIKFMGDYDFNKEYFPNQIVRVNPFLQYRDQTNTLIPFGNTDTTPPDDTSPIPINPGLFICTYYVPPATSNETWLSSYVAPQFPFGIPFNFVQGTRFYEFNCYYPTWPEIPSYATTSVVIFDGVSSVKANQCYWKAMPFGSIVTSGCVGNNTSTIMTIGYNSGSMYNTDYLPYQP